MRFQHLESLSLCGCTELNDSGLTRLLSYGLNLQKLNLDCCLKVTDYGLSLVASGCPSLTSISLYRCINISDDGLETLATACLSLKCINLSYCSQISDKGLKALTQRCRQLQAVNISHCESIRGVGFKGCSKSLTHVEAWSCKLNPEGVTGIISGGGIEYLDVSCLSWYPLGDTLLGIRLSSNLKVLNFRMCRSVSDTSIVAIAMGCTLLEEWNLALCHEVRISGWQVVGLYCQNLKRLHVNRCRNLNDNGLQALRDGCRSLSVLYLNGCVHVTPFALELFKSHRANVCIKDEELLLPLVSFHRYEGDEVNLTIAKAEAKILHEKISKKAYNDDDLIRILATRRKAQVNATLNHYKDAFGKDINKDLKEDPKDEFLSLLRSTVKCLTRPEKYFAKIVRLSINKHGTDEGALTRVVATRAEIDLKIVADEYQRRDSVPLDRAIVKDTTGMLQNPEYRQRLEEMLNNMGGGTEWDSRMMDTLKNFDLNSPAVKQQFDQIGQKLGEGVKGVYISIDVDCLDPAFAPGVSHIEPGGLSFRDVLNILHNLQGDVVAGDVVELNPQRDTVDGMTAMVAAKLVREMAAKIAK
ncbi:hypothetical protein RYX36_024066 [Vicia faba]